MTHQVVPKLSIQGLCNSHTGPESIVWEQPDMSPCTTVAAHQHVYHGVDSDCMRQLSNRFCLCRPSQSVGLVLPTLAMALFPTAALNFPQVHIHLRQPPAAPSKCQPKWLHNHTYLCLLDYEHLWTKETYQISHLPLFPWCCLEVACNKYVFQKYA